MTLAPNQVLQDRYRVVRIIKSGGMGSVYEAIDTKLADSPCAIKEVLEEARTGPDAAYIQSRFYEEMKALARLDHPAIPKVRDFLTLNSTVYIVMDLIQGRSLLEEVLESQQPLEPDLIALDMVHLLEALTYLHSQVPPIIHRDIKPANVLRDRRSGNIKLVDFGLARQLLGPNTQTMVGTLGYAAPEQMMGKSEPRSDLYSVGVTMEHLLTGRIPDPQLLQGHRPDLPGLPAGLLDILEKSTQPRMDDRYRSAQDMSQALKVWLNKSGLIESSTPPVATPGAPAAVAPTSVSPSSGGKQKLLWGGALLLALGVGVMVGKHEPASSPSARVLNQSPQPITPATPIAAIPVLTTTPVITTPTPTLTSNPTPIPVSADKQALTKYLHTVHEEIQGLRKIGDESTKALSTMGQRSQGNLELALVEIISSLQHMQSQLGETRQRLGKLRPPPGAQRLQTLVNEDCDLWVDCLNQSMERCQRTQTALEQARALPPGRRLPHLQRTLQGMQRSLPNLLSTLGQAKQKMYELNAEADSVAKLAGIQPINRPDDRD